MNVGAFEIVVGLLGLFLAVLPLILLARIASNTARSADANEQLLEIEKVRAKRDGLTPVSAAAEKV